MSQEWIAVQLAMRSAANVSQQLRRMNQTNGSANLPPAMRRFLAEAWESHPQDG